MAQRASSALSTSNSNATRARQHVVLQRGAVPAPFSRRAEPARPRSRLLPPALAHQGGRSGGQHLVDISGAQSHGREVARVGLLALMQALAATKLYQAHPSISAPATAISAEPATSFAPPSAAQQLQQALHQALRQQQQPPAQQPPQQAYELSVVRDPQQAAALWTDELHHMQARCQHLSDEVAELLAARQHHPTPAPPAASTASASTIAASTTKEVEGGLFVDDGPEFCPITCQVECAPEVKQAREALRQHIAALSQRSVWVPTAATTNQGGNAATAAPSSSSASEAAVKRLQAQWEATALDVTHTLVRLVQLQQLPAQPKQRVTVRHVKGEVTAYLHARVNKLASTHQQLQQQQQQQLQHVNQPNNMAGAVQPPSTAPSTLAATTTTTTTNAGGNGVLAAVPLQSRSPWQPDPPPAHGGTGRYRQ